MADYILRPAEERDLERVLGIISIHDEAQEQVARRFLKDYFHNKPDPSEAMHYVLEAQGEVVAVGGYIVDKQENICWIGLLYVDPYYRGQGLGTQLLNRVTQDTKKLGHDRLFVSVDQEDYSDTVIRFYTGNKFSNSSHCIKPPLEPIQQQHTFCRKIDDKKPVEA